MFILKQSYQGIVSVHKQSDHGLQCLFEGSLNRVYSVCLRAVSSRSIVFAQELSD